jgi:FKBP-type peptidyl-prolyl cis-trans isomerase FklB
MKKIRTSFLCASIAVPLLFTSIAHAETAIKTDKQKFSYAIGFQIGNNLKRDALDVDVDAIGQAIKDVLAGKDPQVTTEDMQKVVMAFQKKQAEERQAKAEEAKKAGKDFLEKNKKEKGIKVTDSGLQYKVIQKGKGNKPKATDTIVAHYKGTLINGKEFDSSYGRGQPATFAVNQVIKGWQEVLPMMETGAKWQVFIPSDLAYGERGAGANIGPNETLIFDIELLEIKK